MHAGYDTALESFTNMCVSLPLPYQYLSTNRSCILSTTKSQWHYENRKVHKPSFTIILQDEGTLVYADFGQHPAPVKSNTIHLDDSCVEYALLDHSAHKIKLQHCKNYQQQKKILNSVTVHIHVLFTGA